MADDTNEKEVTREARIKAAAEKIKAREEAEIAAEAAAIVDAEIAAEAEAKRQAEIDIQNAKIREEAAKARAAAFKPFCKSIGDFMLANGLEDPRSIPDSALQDLRRKAGL